MNFSRLFCLSFSCARGVVHLDADMPEHIDPDLMNHGNVKPERPIRFKVQAGSRWCDVLGTTHAILKICSPAFFDVLEEFRFSGWVDYGVAVSSGQKTAVGHIVGIYLDLQHELQIDTIWALASAVLDC